MIVINNVALADGTITQLTIPSDTTSMIDGDGLTALPAVIDPHVHFRTPGLTHKEDWVHAARCAINGGCTMVFDMPNVLPPTITEKLLIEKKALIEQQLLEANIPLRYALYIGADKQHLEQIEKVKNQVIGIKVFMGCSTGNLVIDDDQSLEMVFELAAKNDMLVAVHAEDEALLKEKHAQHFVAGDYACHSKIRSIDVAVKAVEKAIALAKKHKTRLYILHVSSADEIALIKQAKIAGVNVFAETTPHHFYFNTSAYTKLKGRACVNPSLRDIDQREAIIQGIKDRVIDTIGSDHAPHTIEEKEKPYGQCPSGMPGIEFMLPVLLTAHARGELTLDEIIGLTSRHAHSIFRLQNFNDWVLVNLEETRDVTHTASKCGWSPYRGHRLTGWPAVTIMRGKIFRLHEGVVSV